ncbi:MAG: hypothetical protein ACYDEN_04165 [Acidimicrobiales bacterium]
MTDHRAWGHTTTAEPIIDEMIEHFADEAERGHQPGQLKGRRGDRGGHRSATRPSRSSPYGWSRNCATKSLVVRKTRA